jgi:hypothetical protein
MIERLRAGEGRRKGTGSDDSIEQLDQHALRSGGGNSGYHWLRLPNAGFLLVESLMFGNDGGEE